MSAAKVWEDYSPHQATKKRRQEQNKQIWQDLHSTWLKKNSAKESKVQPAKEEANESCGSRTGSNMMSRSEPNPHWLAVGHKTTNEATNVGRCLGDAILLRVLASVNGRQ